jgi:hypothetical protein
MTNRPWMISRRTLLRGLGTAIALPVLDAMAPSLARAQAAGAAPRRMLAYYVPCGMHMPAFWPSTPGPNWSSPTLAPLAPLRSKVLVLGNVANRPAFPDGPGDHASGTGAFLTNAHPFKTEGTNIRNGISVDQYAAQQLGNVTRFASLQLGGEGGGSTGNCDSGYSCAYARNISWSSDTTPLPKETNPAAVFDRLFAGVDPNETVEARAKRKRYRQSVLDFVKVDAQSLKAKLGRGDNRKLDEYLTGLREVELRVQGIDDAQGCQVSAAPANDPDVRARVRAMSDLMVMAMQCDLTRVITFMLGNAGSNRVYDFLGIGEGHHEISHHQSLQDNFDKLKRIDLWEIEQLAYLLARMDAVREGEGTLLDNSVVFFSGEIEDGNSHSHLDMPVLLAGRGGGTIDSGRYVRFAEEQSFGGLFVTMLRTMGIRASHFGLEGTGPLPGILA